MIEESWKDIEGFDGYYQVSNLGRVRSLSREVVYTDGRVYKIPEKILRINFCGKYKIPTVHLYKEKKRQAHLLHRLVALAFIPNPDNKTDVNHIDGNRKNNTASNLEWSSRLENMRHGFYNGLINNTGTNHGNNIYTQDQIQQVVNLIYLGYKQKYIQDKTGVKIGTIQAVRQGKQWTHVQPEYIIINEKFSGDTGDL